MTNVALMLKAPRAGQVKTRLASSIGVRNAQPESIVHSSSINWRKYRASWRVVIHFAPSDAEAEMRTWLGGLSHRSD